MIIKIDFGFDVDYIYCPNKISTKKEKIVELFSKWIYNENSNHSFWICDEYGNKEGVDYRAEAIIQWINNYTLLDPKDKAYMIASCTSKNIKYDYKISL